MTDWRAIRERLESIHAFWRSNGWLDRDGYLLAPGASPEPPWIGSVARGRAIAQKIAGAQEEKP